MLRPKFFKNEIYHIYNRGVDKRNVFLDDFDHLRFIHDLFEFNDIAAAPSINARVGRQKSEYIMASDLIKYVEVRLPHIKRKPRKLLVEILCFCLMDNHFHLMIRPLVEGGVTKFMRKLGTGYTNYFNLKYERAGALFQGKFKAVHLKDDAHFLYLPFYIHFNSLDFKFPEWREGKLRNPKAAIEYLKNYRWSSLPDYIGTKNFPSVTQRDFLNTTLGEPDKHKKAVEKWLKNMDLSTIENFKNINLE